MSLIEKLSALGNKPIEIKSLKNYRRIVAENLDVETAILFDKNLSFEIYKGLDAAVEYYDENSLKVRVFGKWHPVPRKMASITIFPWFCKRLEVTLFHHFLYFRSELRR